MDNTEIIFVTIICSLSFICLVVFIYELIKIFPCNCKKKKNCMMVHPIEDSNSEIELINNEIQNDI